MDKEIKKSNCAEEQIAFALKQAELGTPISEVCRKLVLAEQMIPSMYPARPKAEILIVAPTCTHPL